MTTKQFGEFTFSSAFSHGWATFTGNYPLLLGATLLNTAIGYAMSFVNQATMSAGPCIGAPIALTLALLVTIPIGVGMVYLPVRLVRGNSRGIVDVFVAYAHYLRVIGLYIVLGLLIFAVSIPVVGLIVIGSMVGAAVGSGATVVLIILIGFPFALVFMVICLRLWFSSLVLVDEQGPMPGITESISMCWRMTSGYSVWGRLIFVALALGGISIACSSILFAYTLAQGFGPNTTAVPIWISIPLSAPLILFGAPLTMSVWASVYVLVAANFGGWFLREDACRKCGYDTRGLSGPMCPECGTALV